MRLIFLFLLLYFLPSGMRPNSRYFFSDDSLHLKKDTIVVQATQDTCKNKNISLTVPDSSGATTLSSQAIIKLDKIVKRNGDSILCKIVTKNLYEVEYQKNGSNTIIKLSTASIKELFYASGKYELIDNNPEKKKKDWTVTAAEKDWSKILVTSEKNDVAGMVEKGEIEAAFEAKKMNTDIEFLERNAYSILRKKAYSLKAVAVLVVSKTINRTYGELPNIAVKAVAYGK